MWMTSTIQPWVECGNGDRQAGGGLVGRQNEIGDVDAYYPMEDLRSITILQQCRGTRM